MNMHVSRIRVLVAKPGLDGHDRGAKIIATALRNAGIEVIYSGLHQTPESIVSAALQEDVMVIGLSMLSGAHKAICRKVIKLMAQNGLDDVDVIVGGIIPAADVPYLKQLGVREVFGPGSSTREIAAYIQVLADQRGRREAEHRQGELRAVGGDGSLGSSPVIPPVSIAAIVPEHAGQLGASETI
jgi:methylmalonyl-CoA mutase, C-terminal domain